MQRPDAVDPYRGTGLIREILEIGLDRLNPVNPQAVIYLGMSSLAERDLAAYLRGNSRVNVERLGEPEEIPLKILNVNEKRDWIDFLVREHGLVYSPQRGRNEGFEFWHKISVLKITPR